MMKLTHAKSFFLVIYIGLANYCLGEDFGLFDYGLVTKDNKISTEGRQQYETIVQYSKTPRYGSCWIEALDDLHTGCKDLTEDVQRQMAFTFANCFLKGAGRRAIPCPINAPITTCLQDADSTSFAAYQEFFVHTQNVCFFLRNEVWQEGTLNTLSKLASVSSRVVDKLEQTGATQDQILKMQRDSYGIQEKIIEQGQVLGTTLQESQLKAEMAIKEFEKNTKEQQMIIHQVFDRIVQIQSSVFGLFSGIDSIIFYTIALMTSYFITMPARTRGARMAIFPLWAVSLIIESRIKRPDISNQDHLQMELSRLDYHWWILFWRMVTTGLTCLSCAIQYLRYVDYNYQTYIKLDQVSREMEEMKRCILSITTNSFKGQNIDSPVHYLPDPRLNCHDNDSDSQYDSTFIGSSSSDSGDESDNSHDSFITSIMDEQHSSNLGDESMNTSIPSNIISVSVGYNLRSRSKTSTPNPILQKESPKTFERIIKNYSKLRKEVNLVKKNF